MDIRERPKTGPIILTDLDAVPEPRNLRRLKAAIRDRWGTVPLLDMLTETALRPHPLLAQYDRTDLLGKPPDQPALIRPCVSRTGFEP